MTRQFLTRLATALVLTLSAGDVLAQADACQQYRAELAALDRGGAAREYAALADRQLQEINRMRSYYRSLGCERGGFLLFNAPPRPECRDADRRLASMEANYSRLAQQAAGASGERRRALLAAIERTCNQRQAPRGLFDSLFGPREDPTPYNQPGEQLFPEEARPGEEGPVRVGGGRPVCVRTCDGSFFPLANTATRKNGEQLCQALCPGTETTLYYLPGDSDLRRAVSAQGKPYTALPNAFAFQTRFDGSCSCRKPGQTWAQALREAEAMIELRRGDIVVTAEKAEELSRPKEQRTDQARAGDNARSTASTRAQGAARDAAAEAADAEAAAAASAAAAPTASTESAGIGPRAITSGSVVGRDSGPTREVVDSSGERRAVRIVAPNIVPVPQQRM